MADEPKPEKLRVWWIVDGVLLHEGTALQEAGEKVGPFASKLEAGLWQRRVEDSSKWAVGAFLAFVLGAVIGVAVMS